MVKVTTTIQSKHNEVPIIKEPIVLSKKSEVSTVIVRTETFSFKRVKDRIKEEQISSLPINIFIHKLSESSVAFINNYPLVSKFGDSVQTEINSISNKFHQLEISHVSVPKVTFLSKFFSSREHILKELASTFSKLETQIEDIIYTVDLLETSWETLNKELINHIKVMQILEDEINSTQHFSQERIKSSEFELKRISLLNSKIVFDNVKSVLVVKRAIAENFKELKKDYDMFINPSMRVLNSLNSREFYRKINELINKIQGFNV